MSASPLEPSPFFLDSPLVTIITNTTTTAAATHKTAGMGLPILLAQCVAMFVASFAFGSLPLMFHSAMSGKRLKAVSVLGMGLLVGAALTVIIPEGITTLYESLPADRSNGHEEGTTHAIGLSLLSGFALMLLIESLMPHPPHSPPPSPLSTPRSPSPTTPTTPLYTDSGRPSVEGPRPPNQHMDSHTPIIAKRMHVEDAEQGKGYHEGHGSMVEGGVRGLNATLGLVIHGAADGIALGASSLSGRKSLGLIVFLAVLVHKGPTALGLTTTLMSLKLCPPSIRRRLFIFSLAAPLGAIATYLLVSLFGYHGSDGSSEIDGLSWWTGIALLFSGGSFLYVATVIQPLSSDSSAEHSHSSHAHADSGHPDDPQLGKYVRTALLVGGMILPMGLGLLVGDH